jgi:type IV pilus assembly protein PilN
VIKINLLTAERKVVKSKKAAALGAAQKMTVGASLILILTGVVIGWRYWAVARDSKKLDADIAAAQKETQRLHSIITQVQAFEQRKSQLQTRVALIEQLRKEQTGPVHMLDQISRSLPPMVWLTELRQTGTDNEVMISGQATTITSVSDFVASLEASGYFKKSIEIVSSTTQPIPTPPGEIVAFQLKAIFQQPGSAAAAATAPGAPAADVPAKGN